MRFESLGQWHDYWSVVLLSAPDNFREYDPATLKMAPVPDQRAALQEAYETILVALPFADRKVKDAFQIRIIYELIQMAFEAYRAGDGKVGNHTLQEAEGMIWTGSAMPVKYAVEAERRAFGAISRYKDVRVSPYPYEGTRGDLGPGQGALLGVAEAHCRNSFAHKEEFKYLCWVQRTDGVVERASEPSRKKLEQRLERQARSGEISAAVIAVLVVSAVSGLIYYHLHETERPLIQAVAITSAWNYDDLRFHLHEPTIFAVRAA